DVPGRVLDHVAVGGRGGQRQRVGWIARLDRVVTEKDDRDLVRIGHRLREGSVQVGRRLHRWAVYPQVVDVDFERVIGLAGKERGQAVGDDVEVAMVERG